MRKKSTKRPQKAKPAVQLKDIKSKDDAKGGRGTSGNTIYVGSANGGVWKTTN
jgi:hypothetical protein